MTNTNITNETNKLMVAPVTNMVGFYGTVKYTEDLTDTEAQTAWECAMHTITEVAGGQEILARNFLRDRTYGYNFGKAVIRNYHGTLESRIQQASGEEWVLDGLEDLFLKDFEKDLFENDPARP